MQATRTQVVNVTATTAMPVRKSLSQLMWQNLEDGFANSNPPIFCHSFCCSLFVSSVIIFTITNNVDISTESFRTIKSSKEDSLASLSSSSIRYCYVLCTTSNLWRYVLMFLQELYIFRRLNRSNRTLAQSHQASVPSAMQSLKIKTCVVRGLPSKIMYVVNIISNISAYVFVKLVFRFYQNCCKRHLALEFGWNR